MLIEAKALQLHHDLLMAFDQQPFIWNVTQESANEDKVGTYFKNRDADLDFDLFEN